MTATRPTTEVRPPEARPRPRRLGVVLGLVVLILVLAAAGVTLWLTWGGETPGIDDYVAAVNSGDYDRVGNLLEESGGWADHAQWLIATEADLEARDCTVASEAIEPVPMTYERCTIGFGDSWFYNRAGLDDATTTLQVSVTDDVLRVVTFPAPEGLTDVEHGFRVWMEENHPDRVAPMYRGVFLENATPLTSMMFDRTSGETHMEFLEEYLASIG